MENLFKNIGYIVGFLFIIMLLGLLLGFPIMWLWNWLMPIIFELPRITFWQAVGLNILSVCLIRSYEIKTN